MLTQLWHIRQQSLGMDSSHLQPTLVLCKIEYQEVVGGIVESGKGVSD